MSLQEHDYTAETTDIDSESDVDEACPTAEDQLADLQEPQRDLTALNNDPTGDLCGDLQMNLVADEPVSLLTNVRECKFSGLMKKFRIHEYSASIHGPGLGDMKEDDDERVRKLRMYRAEFMEQVVAKCGPATHFNGRTISSLAFLKMHTFTGKKHEDVALCMELKEGRSFGLYPEKTETFEEMMRRSEQREMIMRLILENFASGTDFAPVRRNFFHRQLTSFAHNSDELTEWERVGDGAKYTLALDVDGVDAMRVWKGVRAVIEEVKLGFVLKCSPMMRCLSLKTVLDELVEMHDQCAEEKEEKQEFAEFAKEYVCGRTVVTKYNMRVYRITDYDVNLQPSNTFQCTDATTGKLHETTFADYVRDRYGETDVEEKQGMLVNQSKQRGEVKEIHLIPSLCYFTGQSRKQRSSMKFMDNFAKKKTEARKDGKFRVKKFLEAIVQEQKRRRDAPEDSPTETPGDADVPANGGGGNDEDLPNSPPDAKVFPDQSERESAPEAASLKRGATMTILEEDEAAHAKLASGESLDKTSSRRENNCRVELKRPFDIATEDCVVSGRVLPPTDLHVMSDHEDGHVLTCLSKLPDYSSKTLTLDESSVLNGKSVAICEVVMKGQSGGFLDEVSASFARACEQRGASFLHENSAPHAFHMPMTVVESTENRDDFAKELTSQLRAFLSDRSLGFVVFLLPKHAAQDVVYEAVKLVTLGEVGIPSQCVKETTLFSEQEHRQDGDSMMCNVVSQCLAKLGVPLWSLSMRPDLSATFDSGGEAPVLLLGMDVNHDRAQDHSTVGFCSTPDFETCHSQLLTVPHRQELVKETASLVDGAVNNFFDRRAGDLPAKIQIIMYRDGVADSQFDAVKSREVDPLTNDFEQRKAAAVQSLTAQLEEEANSELRAKLQRRLDGWAALEEILVLYIVVQKRVALTLRREGPGRELVAAKRGTVVDDEITSKKFQDFYLVSQDTAGQVQARCTRYIVLHQEACDFELPDIEAFTNALCSMYYAVYGSVRVPAIVKQADRLAYLFGSGMRASKDLALKNGGSLLNKPFML